MRLPDGGLLQLYGQINRGVLTYDDGGEGHVYPLIDNGNSGSRLGVEYTRALTGLTVRGVVEIGWTPYSSDRANLLDDRPGSSEYPLDKNNIRKLEAVLQWPRIGTLSVGQGSMATDGITESDLSGTAVAAYSAVGGAAGGQLFRRTAADGRPGTLSSIRVADAFATLDGDRRARIRLDSPPLGGGITASLSYGHDLLNDDPAVRARPLWGAALRLDRRQGAWWVDAGAGLHLAEAGSTLAGSVSTLHVPSGLNATLALGRDVADGQDSGYLKFGWRGALVPWGESAISVDLFRGRDVMLDPAAGIAASDSFSWGIGAVQKIDSARVELWAVLRRYDYADDLDRYEPGQVAFAGLRWRF